MTVNDEQWGLIDKKYGKLIMFIAQRIRGDDTIASFEDNCAHLRLVALGSVKAYGKKENRSFDEFWGSEGFDKYIKTCLWNYLRRKMGEIKKRHCVTSRVVDTQVFELILDSYSTRMGECAMETKLFLKEIRSSLNPIQVKIFDAVFEDPSLVKVGGKINKDRLGQQLNVSWYSLSVQLKAIERIMKRELHGS
jgi:hypothetical protein